MAHDPIPVIQVKGTYRQVGQQIGEAMRPQAQRVLKEMRDSVPPFATWDEMLEKGKLFLAHGRMVYPQFIEELEGIAEGANIPFEEVFLSQCEGLWERPIWDIWIGGCTDFAARGRATLHGHTLLAHTNDLRPVMERELVILKVQAEQDPEFIGVSIAGLGFSAGFNAAGIGLTGNDVSSNDVRVGVPRLLIVREILAARRLGEAMNACLVHQRASNYNNIIADANGEIYSVEGSATDCEAIYIDRDIMAHANHYISLPMRRYEADRNLIGGSVIRHHRAMRLLRENFGKLSPELLMQLMADHANYPESICKHAGRTITVFSIVINLSELRAWIGPGRPCETTYSEHALDAWDPPEDWKV
jgi:isopenicillin-N N-acyltransferase-like protein